MTSRLTSTLLGLTLISASALAASVTSNRVYDAYFLGFEADPAMDYGGRDVITLHSALTRGIGTLTGAERVPAISPAYEFVSALGLSVVQHEVFGHGSRGREFNLDPDYGFGIDFSGWTSVNKDPESNEQNILLTAGGTEADSVLAHRIIKDLYTGDGTDGSKIALMIVTKLDFSLYCLSTPDPSESEDDFDDAYENGNDIAYYLVSRQAQRRNGSPSEVWNTDYAVDYDDPSLQDNYEEVQQAAIWNLIDPSAWAAMYSYVTEHVIDGRTQIRPPVVPLGGGFGLTAGTRAFIGPDEVTRILDLYWLTPGPLVTVYGRDLANPVDRTFGWGGGLHGIPLPAGITLGLSGDMWKVPESDEQLYSGDDGWNASGEVDALVSRHVGVSFKVGTKSDGFFPGTPMDSGVYGGAGVLVAF